MIPAGSKVAVVIMNTDCTKSALLREGVTLPHTDIANGETYLEAAKRLLDELGVGYLVQPEFVRYISYSSRNDVGNVYVMATTTNRVNCPSSFCWGDVDSFYNPFGGADECYQLALMLEAKSLLSKK